MLCPTEALLFSSQFRRLYDKKIKGMAESYGLTSAEVNVLLFLANNPEYNTAKDISEIRMLPKSCVSKAVDSLIRQGFLTSREDEKDRRILRLFILPAADGVVKDAQANQKEFLSGAFRNFTEEERQTLDHLTEKLIVNIKEELEEC